MNAVDCASVLTSNLLTRHTGVKNLTQKLKPLDQGFHLTNARQINKIQIKTSKLTGKPKEMRRKKLALVTKKVGHQSRLSSTKITNCEAAWSLVEKNSLLLDAHRQKIVEFGPIPYAVQGLFFRRVTNLSEPSNRITRRVVKRIALKSMTSR